MTEGEAKTNPLLVGLHAARANVLPGLVVQALMVALVAGYYFYRPSAALLEGLSRMRAEIGLPFAVLSTVVAGSVLPELFKVVFFQGGRATRGNLRTLGLTAILWGCQGIVVDVLYRLQSYWFGDALTFQTVATKVALDQFVFNPLFAGIVNTLWYHLLVVGFTWENARRGLTWDFYRRNVIPVLIATWGVWVPIVTAVYLLPQALQFPLFTLALTFWAILLAWIGRAQVKRAGEVVG